MKALMAVDGSEGSESALSVFQNMVREPDSVVLLHVRSDGKPMTDARVRDLKSETVMAFLRKELESTGRVTVKILVREGKPSHEILRAARQEQADLIIMVSRKTGLLRPAAGYVTKEVERSAAVPVLVSKINGCKKSIAYDWRGEVYAAQ